MHSQRISETALFPWVILKPSAKKDELGAEIITAGCDRVAGLGAAGTHIAALVFYLECSCRIRAKTTVTGVKAYWMLPGNKLNVKPARVRAVPFLIWGGRNKVKNVVRGEQGVPKMYVGGRRGSI